MKSKLNYLDVACTFPEQHDVHDGQNGEFIRLFKVERNHPGRRTGWKLDTYKIFSKIIDIECSSNEDTTIATPCKVPSFHRPLLD